MSSTGAMVNVQLADGSTIKGWLYHDGVAGLFVALDPEGHEIRFIPRGAWTSCSFDHTNMAKFSSPEREGVHGETERRAEEQLERAIVSTLDRTDFNRTRRILVSFEEALAEYEGVYRRISRGDAKSGERNVAEIAIAIRGSYRELLDELQHSGAADVLIEHSEQIQSIVRERGIPGVDYHWARERLHYLGGELTLDSLIILGQRENLLREFKLGRDLTDQVSSVRLARDADLADTGLAVPPPEAQKPKSPWSRRLKKIAAVGKMAVGGGLAAANVCVGATIGIVSALPTLGVGTVAGAIGIATSAYTGLNAACDALKDLAGALE